MTTRSDGKLMTLMTVTLVVALLSLLQRTPLAPLPHSADGFIAGLAIGFGIVTLIGWFTSRR